jgi:signal transduction histidine kinase
VRSVSLRWQLSATYAGIALLTVVVLGGVLVSVLANYYRGAEDDYLRAATQRVSSSLTKSGALPTDISRQASVLALNTQTRVRIYAPSGKLLADSGSPEQIDPDQLFSRSSTSQTGTVSTSQTGTVSTSQTGTVSASSAGTRTPGESSSRTATSPASVPATDVFRGSLPTTGSARQQDQPSLPAPLGSGFFGSQNTTGPRSTRTLRTALTASTGTVLGSVLLSDGPASGTDVLLGVEEALFVAGIIAVLASAITGYLLSSRISEPIVELTGVADRMAEGDLSARATTKGDDEVGRLSASFNGMADRIEDTVTALRRFVADAAHEIGTPLTALQADLELAESAPHPEDGARFVKRALVQARRLEDLSAGLLHLSRLEAGETSPSVAVSDAAAVIQEATDAVASRAEQAGVTLLTKVDPGALRVCAGDETLGAIIDSLLDNAIKFTPSGGTVEAGARREGNQALLWIADTGIGIPESEQAGVFERFYRARNVPAYPGSGLGLAIARATVERLSGSIGFTSSAEGTRFEVRLPVA